jgi:hypothetical protein
LHKVFLKKYSNKLNPIFFWVFVGMKWEVTSLAWTQCGRLDNPPKSASKHAFIIIII